MAVVGDATKARFIAAFIDNLIAAGVMFTCVILVPESMPSVKGVLIVTTYLGYFVVLEATWSRTIGKYQQGLVVRKLDGSKCDLKAAIVRSALRVIEINPLLLGGIPAGLVVISTERKQRMGDLLAGTIVVSDTLEWESIPISIDE